MAFMTAGFAVATPLPRRQTRARRGRASPHCAIRSVGGDGVGEKGGGSGVPDGGRDADAPAQRGRKAGRSAAKRDRPRLSYTDAAPTPSTVTLDTIGVVRSPYRERFGTPRQPGVTAGTLGGVAQKARVELYDGRRFELALRGLGDFEYCWVVSYFHLNQGWRPLVTPPRGPRARQGVFATRAPHRPNPVGLSCVRVTGVDEAARAIHFEGCDLLDGTAVLDIKPYVPYADAFPHARAGWLDALDQDMRAPDLLGYSPPPAHLRAPADGGGPNDNDGAGAGSGGAV